MTFNVFTSPKKAFEHSIEEPSIGISLIIVLLTGIIWSALSLVLLNDIISAGTIIFVNLTQWLSLSVLLFVFQIMFSKRNKHKNNTEINFKIALSVVGKLWIYALITAVLFNLFAFNAGNIIGIVAGILIFVVSLFAIYASFIAVKVVIDASTSRALVAWFLLLIVYFLLMAAASAITTLFLI